MRRLLFGMTICTLLLAPPALAASATGGPPSPPDPGAAETAGDAPPDAALARQVFAQSFAEECAWGLEGWAGSSEPDVYDLTFRASYDAPDAPERAMRIYRFDCDSGAYNLRSVWMRWESDEGLRPLSFATPFFTVRYKDGDELDAEVEAVTLEGMTSYATLTNSWYDPATRTIHSYALWRGIGDAFDAGAWQQADTEFVLKSFDVDASYDGEENPVRLVEYPGALPLAPMPQGANGDEVDEEEDAGEVSGG
jgi:hypothetical protein